MFEIATEKNIEVEYLPASWQTSSYSDTDLMHAFRWLIHIDINVYADTSF